MSVEGLVVLVTGAARGMGREYVRGFMREGAKIVATDLAWSPSGVSNDDDEFLAEIRDHPSVLTATMDVTIDSHVHRVFEAAMQRFGTIDVIINNAGLRQRDLYPPHGSVTLLDTAIGDWQRMFDTHVFSAVRVIKTFTPPMLAQRRGSIINIGSGGWAGEARASREMPYKSAKAALANLTFSGAAPARAPSHRPTAAEARPRRTPGALPGATGRQRRDGPGDPRPAVEQRARPWRY
jgi:NAD(P)-dependent dehydrogenase (short-subunit alcohol dehydrogenase family)